MPIAITACGECLAGNHANHKTPPRGWRSWLVSSICPCTGECATHTATPMTENATETERQTVELADLFARRYGFDNLADVRPADLIEIILGDAHIAVTWHQSKLPITIHEAPELLDQEGTS